MELRLRLALLVVDQLLQVVVKRAVIDLFDHLFFFFRERRPEKAGIDQAEQLVLEFPVAGQLIGDRLYCTIAVRSLDGEWIEKQDVGTESNTEPEKGQASDAFKRAGFNWGIGRELYTAPFIWITAGDCNIKTGKNGKPACYDRFRVTKIGYDDTGTISALEIVNAKTGKVVFASGDALTGRTDTNRSRLIRACDKIGQPLDDVAREYGLNRDSTEDEFGIALNKIMERFGNGRRQRI